MNRATLPRAIALVAASLLGGLVALSGVALTGDLGGGTTTVVRTSPVPTAAAPVVQTSEGLSVREIYARAAPGVVQITSTAATTENPTLFPFEQAAPQQALGSGFVIDKAGHIVTNYHVIEGADQIEVSFSNQDQMRATLVGSGVRLRELAWTRSTAMSVEGSLPTSVARIWSWFEKLTSIWSAPSITW